MVFSQNAIRLGINNTPNKTQIKALTELCVHVLEPLRTLVEKSINVTSGYRSPDLNRAIGVRDKQGRVKYVKNKPK